MAVHFQGPVLNKDRPVIGARGFFSEMPVGCDPDYVVAQNDFLFSQDYDASDWVVTETQVGATQAIAADAVNGALLLTNSAADDDVVQLQSAEEWLKLAAGKKLWFETKLQISDVTESDFFVGLATTDTSIIAGTTDCVGFRKLDGVATPVAITEDNTSETTTTLAAMTAATDVVLGFYWDGVGSVHFYVNRNWVATHTANIEQTNKLALTFCLQNGEAAAKTMQIDYFFVCKQR